MAEVANRLVGAHPASKDPLCTIGSIQGGLRGSDVGVRVGATPTHMVQSLGSGSGLVPAPQWAVKHRGVR